MSDQKINQATRFSWAVNKVKLQQAIMGLEKAQTLNPSVVISEETVLEEYKRRGGLVLGAPETATNVITNRKLIKLTIAELVDLSGEKGVDLSGLTRKDEIIAKFAEHGITDVPVVA